jgi:signal peptidase I
MEVVQVKLLILVGILVILRLALTFYGETPEHLRKRMTDWCDTGAVASVVVLLLVSYVFQLSVVDGDSMNPSLEDSEFTIVNKLIYRLHKPERGDIIVFRAWNEEGRDYIKRVIAMPGETVTLKEGWVVVKGLKLNEPYKLKPLDHPFTYPRELWHPNKITVPPGHLFVLGDNRENSTDSRTEGPLPMKNILGKASFIIWPSGRWGFIPSFRGQRFKG